LVAAALLLTTSVGELSRAAAEIRDDVLRMAPLIFDEDFFLSSAAATARAAASAFQRWLS